MFERDGSEKVSFYKHLYILVCLLFTLYTVCVCMLVCVWTFFPHLDSKAARYARDDNIYSQPNSSRSTEVFWGLRKLYLCVVLLLNIIIINQSFIR